MQYWIFVAVNLIAVLLISSLAVKGRDSCALKF